MIANAAALNDETRTDVLVGSSRRHRFDLGVQVDDPSGAFEATQALYHGELARSGWSIVNRRSVGSTFCRAPYVLDVDHSGWFENTHQFTLRLTYRDGQWQCAAPAA